MYGIVMAFQKYNVFKGVFGSEFIGLDVFKKSICKKQISGNAIRNTISLNFATMAINFPLTIIIALMLNELRNLRFKKLTPVCIISSAFYFMGCGIRYRTEYVYDE